MAEKRLTTFNLMQMKTRQEWIDYFYDRKEKGWTRIMMCEELNTTKTNLRNVYNKLFPKQRPGRPTIEKKFKGE